MLLYQVIKSIVTPIVKLVYRPTIEGAENIPGSGPVILASNHLSVSDSIFMPVQVRRPVYFLAKSDYFTGRGLKGRFIRFFMKGIGTVPVDRNGGRRADAAIRSGLGILSRGHVLGIYPEGTRSPDGVLYRGKTGVARLALEARVPIIPVAMIGSREAQPVGTILPRRSPRVRVVVGRPLTFEDSYAVAADRAVLRRVTDTVMEALRDLSGQDYDSSAYAAVVKARLSAAETRGDRAASSRAGAGAPPAGTVRGGDRAAREDSDAGVHPDRDADAADATPDVHDRPATSPGD